MDHIHLDINSYIDLCLSSRLVHDIYLNIMERHFRMIDFEKLYNIFSFSLINCLKWSRWLWSWMFPHRGFTA
jgi:hypothetical protein